MKLPRGLAGFSIYSFFLAVAIYFVPSSALYTHSGRFVFTIGGLAVWRYSWGLIHYLRHLIYIHHYFPKLRRAASPSDDTLLPSHIYLLITSFRIEVETTIQVFQSAFEEAINCGIPATIIASIVEVEDETLVKGIFARMNPPAHITLSIVRIPGTGKRDGLAHGFRAISRDMPAQDALVAVIDGDTILEKGLIRKCVPFFKTRDNLGALTTDEICDVKGSEVIREWHNLRFAQRQILMSSIALSNKVLTLTGRMSMFRADIIVDPDFIDTVQNDSIDHWRLGKFRFLTGDDKSSWYWVLKHGWDMIYVPDAVILTIEHPPSTNFFKASSTLMFRWFGNMLRTNGRALRLGPHKIGLFPWWCVLDQRISMWTSLTGPVFAILLALKHSAAFLGIYFVWIGFTRWVMSVMLLAARPVTSWRYPFLLYYNQVWGSFIKTYVFFRLDQQSWTRQKTKLQRNLTHNQQLWLSASSTFAHIVSVLVFIVAVGLISGILAPPEFIARWF